MDISETLAPTSDQLDAIELVAGPRIFTIASVSAGNAEQPVQVHLAEFPRPWRPGKSMRRVLAFCWSADGSTWVGRRVELFFDPEVTFGKEKPGGTRISRLSHIDGPKKVPLLVTRGKSAPYTVEPLTDEHVIDSLRNEWKTANAARKKTIEAEVAALTKSSGAGAAPEAEAVAVEPESSDAPDVAICPECAAEKHVNCSGQAWDNVADEPTDCACGDESHGGE